MVEDEGRIGRGATEKIVNLRCRFGGYVAYRVCPQVSLSLGLRQGVYCLRRYLRRLSLCKFRRRAVCVVDKRSVGSRSVAAGRRSPHSAAIFGRACPLCPAAFSTSLRGAFSRLVQFGRRWFAPSKYCLGFWRRRAVTYLLKSALPRRRFLRPRTLVCVRCAFDALFYFAKPFQSGKKQLRYFCLYATIHK